MIIEWIGYDLEEFELGEEEDGESTDNEESDCEDPDHWWVADPDCRPVGAEDEDEQAAVGHQPQHLMKRLRNISGPVETT